MMVRQLSISSILVAVFFLCSAVSICVAQCDETNVHILPRIHGTESAETQTSATKAAQIKVDVELVQIPVTVTDDRDRLVIGLQQRNFSIHDRTEPQLIRNFSTDDAPISLGILFDISSSMNGKIDKSSRSVIQVLRDANPQDEFFLITFNDRPELRMDFTTSVEEIQNEISKVKPDGTTALLDAVYLGLDEMRHAHHERKALLIVSDGGDNHSRYGGKEVWSVLLEASVQVYAIGIFDEAPRTKAERSGPDLLGALTAVSGGRTFAIHSLKNIGKAADELSRELRNQYLITYHPSNLVHDGKWHKVRVRVAASQNSRKLRVFAKSGYYAPLQ